MNLFENKIRVAAGFIMLTICLNSCKKFVQVAPPTTGLVTARVFVDNNKATDAQLAIYAQMQSYPWNIAWATGLSSDELRNYVTSNLTNVDLYTNSLNASTDGAKIGLWSQPYNFIYEANSVIESLATYTGTSDPVKRQLTGESKFIRAFWNFYLINLYGDIPLVLSTEYTVTSRVARTPKAQVYQQIIADLTDAQDLLNTNFVDVTDTVTTTERIRPTKWAATALLARVYLYLAVTGENSGWAKAESASSELINNRAMFDTVSLGNVFLKNSKEAIWQLMPNSNNTYTTEGSSFILTSNPATSPGSYTSGLSDQLMTSFEPGDMRRFKWVGTFTSGANSWYFANKYKATYSSTSPTEYSMVLRLGEQYLIRAEARARQSKLPDAISDLNVIRVRAGLPALPGTLTQADILSAVAHERQVELFTEGHRWFDLKRTNSIDSVMTIVTGKKGGDWKSYQREYPIPVADIQNSAGRIAQNSGY